MSIPRSHRCCTDGLPQRAPRRARWLTACVAGSLLVGASLHATQVSASPTDDVVEPRDDSTTSTSTSSTTSTSTSTTTTTTTTSTTTTTTAPATTTIAPTATSSSTTTAPEPEPEIEPSSDSTIAPPTTTRPFDTTPPTTVPPPTARNITVYPEQIQHILATIRYLESRGIYTLPPNKGNASGAYQFIGSTWNNYGGYAHAYLAPPHVQDERAALDVTKFLRQFDNDVSMVPVMWYLPAAAREPWRMDVVPSPQNGNVLTIREYQTRWLAVFAFMSGQPLAPVVTPEQAEDRAGTPPVVPEPIGDVPAIAFPTLGPSRVAVPDCDGAEEVEVTDVDGDAGDAPSGPTLADIRAAGLCTAQAPGIVFGVKLQPVTAVVDGIVTAVVDVPGDPITVTITDRSGTSYEYSGFNDDSPGTDDGAAPDHLRLTALAQVGSPVRAGQIIGFMGDTDPLPVGIRADVPTDATIVLDPNAVAPHIRLTMIDVHGRPLDAFGPVVDALFRQTCSVAIGQWSVPANGSGHEEVTIETTDLHDDIDSQWVITSTGQVTASGWAAMVNPNESCAYAPPTAHGPGADGSDLGLLHWFTPVDLPTSVWVALALQDEVTSPGGLLRPG